MRSFSSFLILILLLAAIPASAGRRDYDGPRPEAATPEPVSSALVGFGLVAGALCARRRNRKGSK